MGLLVEENRMLGHAIQTAVLLGGSEEGTDHETTVPGGSSTAGEWYLEGTVL